MMQQIPNNPMQKFFHGRPEAGGYEPFAKWSNESGSVESATVDGKAVPVHHG